MPGVQCPCAGIMFSTRRAGAVRSSIRENQMVMKWHGERGIPVEVNESHHWSLRDAHDAIGVVTAFFAAYNAKKMGVKDYIAQYMFNVPPAIAPENGSGKNAETRSN